MFDKTRVCVCVCVSARARMCVFTKGQSKCISDYGSWSKHLKKH